jgi:hypothetical protein
MEEETRLSEVAARRVRLGQDGKVAARSLRRRVRWGGVIWQGLRNTCVFENLDIRADCERTVGQSKSISRIINFRRLP